ncbi:RrF2 family transcriptional regulator [Nitrosophilus alvini]|uniref:RrF2 family transcriptional regulator n=1 Tax=Nitrosophilus alvini TaxID=2714855 RepID=UPI00190CD748|nr:Rrf2 family transcriptional regulator [Nitrosophilus alvini]
MTLLSSKGAYGLVAMYELSKEFQFAKPVKIKDIASRANIPQNYLEQLLNTLKKDGFVKSIRGAHGGYMLATHPSNIKVLDIIKSLEGDIKITETSTGNPVLELFYEEAQKKLEEIFDLALEDFKLYQQKVSNRLVYSI